jgi:hypothetical protein
VRGVGWGRKHGEGPSAEEGSCKGGIACEGAGPEVAEEGTKEGSGCECAEGRCEGWAKQVRPSVLDVMGV